MDPHAENYLPVSPYAYVGNNPIIRTDPDGRSFIGAYGTVNHTGAADNYVYDEAGYADRVHSIMGNPSMIINIGDRYYLNGGGNRPNENLADGNMDNGIVNDEPVVEVSADGIYYINENGEKVWFADINTKGGYGIIVTKDWMDAEAAKAYFIGVMNKYSSLSTDLAWISMVGGLGSGFITGVLTGSNMAALIIGGDVTYQTRQLRLAI